MALSPEVPPWPYLLRCHPGPGLLCINAVALLYCVVTVPVELSFWDEYEVCDPLPTMEIDMFTDFFFLVRQPRRWRFYPNDECFILSSQILKTYAGL